MTATTGLALGFAAPAQANELSNFCATYQTTISLPTANAEQKMWCNLQRLIVPLGYSGPIDGLPGVNSWYYLQLFLKTNGYYSGPVDGIPGKNTIIGLQLFAKRWGGYTGLVDGVAGQLTFACANNAAVKARNSPGIAFG